jgi:hypothetical protein
MRFIDAAFAEETAEQAAVLEAEILDLLVVVLLLFVTGSVVRLMESA